MYVCIHISGIHCIFTVKTYSSCLYFKIRRSILFWNKDDNLIERRLFFFRMKMTIIFVVLMFCYVNQLQAVGKTYLIQTVVSKKVKSKENLILQGGMRRAIKLKNLVKQFSKTWWTLFQIINSWKSLNLSIKS